MILKVRRYEKVYYSHNESFFGKQEHRSSRSKRGSLREREKKKRRLVLLDDEDKGIALE